jgi:hypothetical protein
MLLIVLFVHLFDTSRVYDLRLLDIVVSMRDSFVKVNL